MSLVNGNLYVMCCFDERVINRSIVFQVYNFCAVCMEALPCFPRYLTALSKEQMYAYAILDTICISLAIWSVNAVWYKVLISNCVFYVASAFKLLPDSAFSRINAVKPRWQDDIVKLLLKTCSNCCRDINGNLELAASSYFKSCILYLQFTFTY